MRALSLFSGIGGIDIAAEWAGIETIAFCEKDPFCQQVLMKHWPNTALYDDIQTFSKWRLEADGNVSDRRPIDIIFGGFPCQPHSIAGRRKGRDDDKDLWPEMLRVIREFNPRWVVGENVANFANTELERTLTDLENEGYETQSFVIPAAGVGAFHRRKRTFIVAYSFGIGDGIQEGEVQTGRNIAFNSDWWQAEPGVGRVADGVPFQVDRLRALGNAVVPQQIYPIFAAIMQIEAMNIR